MDALIEVVNLRIVTVVDGTYDPTTKTATPNGTVKMMRTTLNLVDGHKVIEVPTDFVTGPLAVLRDYHQQQEAAGHEIIKSNVETLLKLLAAVRSLRKS